MDKYNDGKIYRLDVIGCEKVYIGSCIISLNERFGLHKRDWNTCSSKELFTYGEPLITLIENYGCKTKIELCMREQYYMDKFKEDGYTLINKNRAYTSPEMVKEQEKEYKKEYYETNKEHIKEYKKKYRETNKEQIKQQRNEKFICECGGKYTNGGKSTHLKTKKHMSFIL